MARKAIPKRLVRLVVKELHCSPGGAVKCIREIEDGFDLSPCKAVNLLLVIVTRDQTPNL